MRKIEFPWWGIIGSSIVRVDVESNQYIYPEYNEEQKCGKPVEKPKGMFREIFRILRFKTVEEAIKELAKIRHQTEEQVLKEVQRNFPSMKITLKKKKRNFFLFWKK